MQWEFVKIKVKDLVQQETNPRRIRKEQKEELQKSISKFGYAQPIVITNDNLIIGGHQRFLIAKSNKELEIECMRALEELNHKQIEELTIRLNKNIGEFDFDMLANYYEPEDLVDWGFTLEELQLEEITNDNKETKTHEILIKFHNADDLNQAERDIESIVGKYIGAFYTVKIK